MNEHMAFHILDTFLRSGSCEVTYTRLAEELSISSNLAKEYLTSYIQNSNPVPNHSLLLELHRHPDLIFCDQDVSTPSVEFKILTNTPQELQETLLRLKEEQKQIVKRAHVFSVWNKTPSDPITLWNCEISLRSKKNELTLLPSNTVYHVTPDKSIPLRVQYQSNSDSATHKVASNQHDTSKFVNLADAVLKGSKSEKAVPTVKTNSLHSNLQLSQEKASFKSHLTKSTSNKTNESLKRCIPNSINHVIVQPKTKVLKSSSLKSAVKISASSLSPVKTLTEPCPASPKKNSTHVDEHSQEDEHMKCDLEQNLWEFNDDEFLTDISPSKDSTVLPHPKTASQEKSIKKVKVTVEKQSKQGKYTVVNTVDEIQHLVVDASLNSERKPNVTAPTPVVRKKQNNLLAFFKPSTT